MGIRLPLQGVLDVTQTDQGPGSLLIGGWAYPFKIPQDTDNVVVKFSPSVTGGGISATFQTSDDGGTTFFDVSRTSIASNSGATTVAGSQAQWLSIPVVGGLDRTIMVPSLIATGSLVAGVSNGSSGASTLGSGQNSGLPIIGIQNRIFLATTGNATAVNARVQVLVNNESQGR